MKKAIIAVALVAVLMPLALFALAESQVSQNQVNPGAGVNQANPPQRLFRCDQNKDGICDFCGQPAGSRQGWRRNANQSGTTITGQNWQGQGRGLGYGRGRGRGGVCPWQQVPQQPQQQP